MAERRRRGDDLIPIADSIAAVAGRLSRADLVGLAAIKEAFPAVAGPQIAAHAEPTRLTAGVLTIAVDQPAWATQMRLLAGRLLEPLAQAGGCAITGVEVVVRAP